MCHSQARLHFMGSAEPSWARMPKESRSQRYFAALPIQGGMKHFSASPKENAKKEYKPAMFDNVGCMFSVCSVHV